MCTLIVTYFIDVCFKEILVLASLRWRDNNAEKCRSYVKDNTHKVQNMALVGIA